MKHLLIVICFFVGHHLEAQQPFQKNNKWGISLEGTGLETDSIIVLAEYDEIRSFKIDADGLYVKKDGLLFCGLKEGEWTIFSDNDLIDQQRYKSLNIVTYNEDYLVAVKEGNLDIIDVLKQDFVFRNLEADLITDVNIMSEGERIFMTQKGNGKYGVIDCGLKIDVLKPVFDTVIMNATPYSEAMYIGYKDGKHFVFDYKGALVIEIETNISVGSVAEYEVMEYEELKNCWEVVHYEERRDPFRYESFYGCYNEKDNWLIAPKYDSLEPLENNSDLIVVKDKKGGVGLFYKGKQILECEFTSIKSSGRKDFVAIATNKKGTFYVTSEGKLKRNKNK